MSPLDNRSVIKQLDRENFLAHIFDVPEQIVDGFALGTDVVLPALYAQAKHIVIVAVGEMYPVAGLLRDMTVATSRVPVTVVEDYVLPRWVSNDTLVIALDYTGNAEQVLVAYREASKRKARLLAVSVGGELAREARRARSLHVPISYGAPARMTFAYAFSCMAAIFARLDLLELKESNATEAAVLCRSFIQNTGPDVAQYQNNAKQLAEKIFTRRAFVVSSGPLATMAHKWMSVCASTGKVAVAPVDLSDFTNLVINTLKPAGRGVEGPMVIMLQSKYDHPRNKLQQTLAYQVVQAQKLLYEQIFMHPSGSLFGEILLASLLGDIVGYYLSLLSGVSPSSTEASDYIRTHLPSETLFG